MADAPLTPEERDGLAAELALGLLDGADRARAMRLRLADPLFAALVDGWHHRLSPLLAEYGAATPSSGVWGGIVRRLDASGLQSAPVSARFWRIGTILGSAIAASLALALLYRAPVKEKPAEVAAIAVAQLVGAPEGPVVVARYDAATAALSLRVNGMPTGALSPELWIIPADGKPRSLGLIASSGAAKVTVSSENRAFMAEGATLAVTMEDAKTAPHAAPGSAPVAAGKISMI